MTDLARDAANVVDLLTRYSFDLSGYTVDRLAEYWLQHYPSDWIRLAVIEALYQGRYKAVSVEQILNLWQRRGKPLHHFNRDFERIIAPHFTKGRTAQSEVIVLSPAYAPLTLELELNTLELDLLELDTQNLELPKPSVAPRPQGAIRPFSVSDILLPKDAMFERFYTQLLASGELQKLTDAESIEVPPYGHLEEIVLSSINSEPMFFPEQPIAEFAPIADPVLKGLPIQPFQPTGDEALLSSLEIPHQAKDLSNPSIHQFVPTLAPSEFYAKLKAIVQNATASKLRKNSGLGEAKDSTEPPESSKH